MEWEQQRTGQTVRSQRILLRHIPVGRLPAAGADQRGCHLTGAIMRSEDGTRVRQVADISRATRRPEATQGYLLAYVGERLAQHGRAGEAPSAVSPVQLRRCGAAEAA